MRKHTISFINAFKGIWTALITQSNIRIHFVIGSVVLFGAAYFRLPIVEIMILVLTISVVIVAEMINTAMEFMCDAVTLEHNENIKWAKDVSAGAVLMAAIFAALIGLMIFVPKLLT
jgi:diacylglycerol kinase